jgi:hypothetical protein
LLSSTHTKIYPNFSIFPTEKPLPNSKKIKFQIEKISPKTPNHQTTKSPKIKKSNLTKKDKTPKSKHQTPKNKKKYLLAYSL